MRSFLNFYNRHTLSVLTIFLVLGTISVFQHLFRQSTRLVKSTALQGAALQSESLSELRPLYTSEVVDRVRGRIEVTHDYEKKAGAIPLPVTLTMKLGQRISRRYSGMEMRLFSHYPFPWRKDGGPQDVFERDALDFLQKNPDKPFYRFEKDRYERLNLRYAVADRMQAKCISCHNTHPSSPKRDWKVGDVRGVFTISSPVATLGLKNQAPLRSTYMVVGAMVLLAIIGLLIIAARLRRTAFELDILVMEKTLELRQANQELEAFNHSVSHDLRSPMTLIKGYSDLLLAQYGPRLDEQGRNFIRSISAAIRRMNQMTEDLLNLSRADNLPLRPETVDLSSMAYDIIDELRAYQPARQVEFSAAATMTALGDRNLLRLALENLLRNAWKYTGKTAKAKIEFGKTSKPGGDVFFIKDNGAGFDMSQVDKLFGVFQRLHTEEEFPGTGIGLGTVARIIKRHGGRIWAEGKPGQGATFYFTLT